MRWLSLSLVLALVLSPIGATHTGIPEPGGAVDRAAAQSSAHPLETPGLAPVPLEELRHSPNAHLGRSVRLVIQLGEPIARWNPYLTRFGTRAYARWQGWADERFLWRREDYEDPASTLFARRGSGAEAALARAQRYDRFVIEGRVLATFLDEPWIEIESVQRLPESVGEGTILHATRALEAQREGRYEIALDQLERASLGLLPEHSRAELERLAEACRAEREATRSRRRPRRPPPQDE